MESKKPPVPLKNYYNQIKAVARHDAKNILHKISAKTLILQGEDDVLCTRQECMSLASLIKGSQLIFIKNTAHMLPIENPMLLSRKIMAFLTND